MLKVKEYSTINHSSSSILCMKKLGAISQSYLKEIATYIQHIFLVANKVGNGIICTFLKSKSISILNSQFITNLLIKESKKLFRAAIN